MSDTIVTTLRLPKVLIERADDLISKVAESDDSLLLGRVSRSIVLRLAVLRGIEHLEAEHAGRRAAPERKRRQSRR